MAVCKVDNVQRAAIQDLHLGVLLGLVPLDGLSSS